MRIAAEAAVEVQHLLVQHGVIGDGVLEVVLLLLLWQLAMQQEVAHLHKVAVLGQILDLVAAMQEDAFFAVDEGDGGLAARRRGEARVVGEHPGLAIELADVNDPRALGAIEDGQLP